MEHEIANKVGKKKTVRTLTPIVESLQEDLCLTAALIGGTTAMRACGKRFLPMWPAEERGAYALRLASAYLFPAFKRTVTALAAKPLSKPIVLEEEMGADIVEWLEDVDLQGRNLHAFVGVLLEEVLGPGLCGVLVDFSTAKQVQRTETGVTTQAAEAAAGLRPYFTLVRAKQLIGWRSVVTEGKWSLEQLRFLECVQERAGEFDVVTVEQVRVLEIGSWRTFRKVSGREDEWALHEQGASTLPFIPYVPVYGEYEEFMVGRPPLREVAHLNVKHWQSQSDQDTILHVARVPMLAVTGVEENPKKPFEIVVGAATAIKLPLNATVQYVEHTGAAIGAGKQSLDDLKEEMREAGAELLMLRPKVVTATEIASDSSVGLCVLQQIALTMQDAVNQCLVYMGAWAKREDFGEVKLFTDFGAATLAETSMQVLVTMATAGKLSDETLHAEAQRRGILSSDVTWEDEQARIESQGPALGPADPFAAATPGDAGGGGGAMDTTPPPSAGPGGAGGGGQQNAAPKGKGAGFGGSGRR